MSNMRRAIVSLGIVFGLSVFAAEARAQNFSDPFYLYYGFFLPRQAAMAATPTVNDKINAATAARQGNAVTNRANLYDPNGNYAPLDDFDGAKGGGARGDARGSHIQNGQFPSGNIAGTGPALYYSRHARYYPTMRVGQSTNRNVSLPTRRGGGMSNYARGSMPQSRINPNAGMGIPGPR